MCGCVTNIAYMHFLLKACGNLTSLPNGEYILVNMSNVLYNASANVTCNLGYDPNVTSVSCLASGEWEIAECIRKGALSIHQTRLFALTFAFIYQHVRNECDMCAMWQCNIVYKQA